MGIRQLYGKSRNANPSKVEFEFAIPTNGATTPVASGIRGRGAVVTRTGVGVYTIVFSAGHKYLDLLEAKAHLRLAAIGNTWAQVGTYVQSTRTLTVNCITSAAVAAEWPAANADNVLHIKVTFGDSHTKPANV